MAEPVVGHNLACSSSISPIFKSFISVLSILSTIRPLSSLPFLDTTFGILTVVSICHSTISKHIFLLIGPCFLASEPSGLFIFLLPVYASWSSLYSEILSAYLFLASSYFFCQLIRLSIFLNHPFS